MIIYSPWPFDRPLKLHSTTWPSSPRRLCLDLERRWLLRMHILRCSDATLVYIHTNLAAGLVVVCVDATVQYKDTQLRLKKERMSVCLPCEPGYIMFNLLISTSWWGTGADWQLLLHLIQPRKNTNCIWFFWESLSINSSCLTSSESSMSSLSHFSSVSSSFTLFGCTSSCAVVDAFL